MAFTARDRRADTRSYLPISRLRLLYPDWTGRGRHSGQTERVERPLTEWEREVVGRLASLDAPGSDVVRESLPHLVVTGMCGCGCASFNVRDCRFPAQPHRLCHFANGSAADLRVGFVLWVGPDGRPISVDVDNEPGTLPDPDSISVSAPGP
jgi:hypothetical protein